MVTRKKTGKKIKALPTKPLSDAKAKTVKGGGFSISHGLGGVSKIVAPVVLPPTPPPPPPIK
ncbi:MAG: hypothetical protein ABI592_06955 [Acidobacteriota bacterium]